MTELPLISVVVPSFNQAQFLAACLESIFCQAYPRLEVVVMDGGSTDRSVEIIRQYEPHLKYWQSQPDGGQGAAINEGMKHCSGELVAWLNSDDYFYSDALWVMGNAFRSFPNYGLYIGNGFRYSEEKGYLPFLKRHIALTRESLTRGLDYILQPSTFFWRTAWDDVGGLDASLHFSMDWDIYLRILETKSAVLINEYIGVSREYAETKTSSGKMRRVEEIRKVAQRHSKNEVTPGSLYFLLETLLDVISDKDLEALRHTLYAGMTQINGYFKHKYGNSDSLPEKSDAQHAIYLPFAKAETVQHPFSTTTLPSVSIITPSYNQAQFLGQTLDSIFNQHYPSLETIVMDGGSKDGSVQVLEQYADRLTYWVSEPDKGPANAINKGLKRSTGEIVAWLASDDMLTEGSLHEVAKAFADDPELDMVFANALYIDENNQLFLADHGTHRTGVYWGFMEPPARAPAYWLYVYSVPQPTVFFRRRLLEKAGYLDESYQFIFDFELFWRFSRVAKVKKLERTQAFYRIHSASKTSSWNKFLVELYRFSRMWWPSVREPAFRTTLRSFVDTYMDKRYGGYPHNFSWRLVAGMVALSAITRRGNPEAWNVPLPLIRRRSIATIKAAPILPSMPSDTTHYVIQHGETRYRIAFCSYLWPRHPGHSGGEIRDFHLLRELLSLSSVDFFALYPITPDNRRDVLRPHLKTLHTDDEWSYALSDAPANEQVYYHSDVQAHLRRVQTLAAQRLQTYLAKEKPDFLFVSPQTNAIALHIQAPETRLIMASYDVEAVRINRIVESYPPSKRIQAQPEAQKAVQFEKDNLAGYDGLIAVSELDKIIFIRDYDFPAERIAVIENSVDADYFSFQERKVNANPQIVFVGSLTYSPNLDAAWRLLDRIMPLVRKRHPKACLWIVGQSPTQELLQRNDGVRTFVTGTVPDVRPYLLQASVACVPLDAGSGTKYKVLEALSAGVPVVCTSVAIEGLHLNHGEHVMLGDSDQELAKGLLQIIEQPTLASSLAANGRHLIEEMYTWDNNLARLGTWLDSIKALPKRQTTL